VTDKGETVILDLTLIVKYFLVIYKYPLIPFLNH